MGNNNHFNRLNDYTIVVPTNCTDAVKNASVQLSYYFEKVTGIVLNTIFSYQYNKSRYISLGDTKLVKKENNHVLKDGFVFDIKDKNVTITALNDTGILYGVYYFIEKILGVKFLSQDCTVIPKNKKIILKDFHVVCNPSFEMRSFVTKDVVKNPEFSSHLRLNNEWMNMPDTLGGVFEFPNAKCHNIFEYIDKNKYYEKHPEWFYVHDGKIKDICYSHVGLNADGTIDDTLEESPVKIIASNFYKMLLNEKNAKYKYFMLGQQDTYDIYVYCRCDDCSTQTEFYGKSGMLIRFINAVSDYVRAQLKKDNIEREFYIVTFAYLWSELPPFDYVANKPLDKTVVPRDNVFIRLAPINTRNYYGIFENGQIDTTKKMFKYWPKITKNLMVWTYNIEFGGYFVYYPTVQHIKQDLSFFKKINVKYVMCQSSFEESHIWFDKMNCYIIAKLLWNNKLNVKKLKDEFITYYYGIASSLIKEFVNNFDMQYYSFLNDNILVENRPSTRIGSGEILSNSKYYSKEFWEKQFVILERCKNLILSSNMTLDERQELLKRINEVLLTPQYMVLLDYDSYYSNKEGKKKLFDEFCNNCKNLGVVYYKEHSTIDEFGKKFLI